MVPAWTSWPPNRLHAQPLPLRVAAVYGGAAAFLMCHAEFPLERCLELDAADLDGGVILPVAAQNLVLLAGCI